MINANSQLGTAAGLGINGAASAANDATSNFGLDSAAGALTQANANAADTNALDQWTGNNTYDQGVLANYDSAINGNVGSSTTGSSTPASNIAGAAAGGAAAGAGLYQNYFGNGDNAPYQLGSSSYGTNGVSNSTLNSIQSSAASGSAGYTPDAYAAGAVY